jgi:hypothetical protein
MIEDNPEAYCYTHKILYPIQLECPICEEELQRFRANEYWENWEREEEK